jgi:thiol-disulfide isomerase/thioredoxin
MKNLGTKLVKRIWIFPILGILFFPVLPVKANTPVPAAQVTIYFFWGDGCPHCEAAKPFLETLQSRYPELSVASFEVYNDVENQELLFQMAKKFGMEQLTVPPFFIGPYHLLGYSPELDADFDSIITLCLQNQCPDAAEGILVVNGVGVSPQPLTLTPTYHLTETPVPQASSLSQVPVQTGQSIVLPWIGKIDLSLQSIGLSTMLIAFVDGFNPCCLL